MAPSYVAGASVVISQVLPLLGIQVAGPDLTTTINTIIAIIAGVVVAYRQWQKGRSTLLGARPAGFVEN